MRRILKSDEWVYVNSIDEYKKSYEDNHNHASRMIVSETIAKLNYIKQHMNASEVDELSTQNISDSIYPFYFSDNLETECETYHCDNGKHKEEYFVVDGYIYGFLIEYENQRVDIISESTYINTKSIKRIHSHRLFYSLSNFLRTLYPYIDLDDIQNKQGKINPCNFEIKNWYENIEFNLDDE